MLVAEKRYYDVYEQYDTVPKTTRKPTGARKTSQSKRNAKAVRTLLGISIFFVISFVIVLRHAALTKLMSDIDKQGKYLSSLEKTNSQLKSDMIVDLNTVDDTAKNKLGMDRPYKYQVVYISLNEEKGQQAKQEEKGFEVAKKISKVVELLY